jgi:hypothetical protein
MAEHVFLADRDGEVRPRAARQRRGRLTTTPRTPSLREPGRRALARLRTPQSRHTSGPGAAWFAVGCALLIGAAVAAWEAGNGWWAVPVLLAAVMAGREAALRVQAGNP